MTLGKLIEPTGLDGKDKMAAVGIPSSGAGGDGFTVYEDLTFVNRKSLQMARNEHKDTPVWTIDGKVFLNVDGRFRPYIPSEDKTRLPLYLHAR